MGRKAKFSFEAKIDIVLRCLNGKTTFDERVEIVQYCISHMYNYSETAEKYGISYQQARNYTIKYEENEIEALQDRRGKRLKKIHTESPDKGYRRIRDDLERYHDIKINDKRVLRICRKKISNPQ